jgi:hypothetical protein
VNKGKQKQKHIMTCGMSDFYKHYCFNSFKEKKGRSVVIHTDSKYNVDPKLYGNILKDFNKAIMSEILYDNFEYTLPSMLGELSIKKYTKSTLEIAKLPIDWKETKSMWEEDPETREQKKLIRQLNDHTNGQIFRFKYNKKKARYKNKSVYKFLACRTAKRELATALKDTNVEINFYQL